MSSVALYNVDVIGSRPMFGIRLGSRLCWLASLFVHDSQGKDTYSMNERSRWIA